MKHILDGLMASPQEKIKKTDFFEKYKSKVIESFKIF